MNAFSAIQSNFRIIVFGLPFLMLAWQAVKLRRYPDLSAPWHYLAWFALGYGLTEWLGLFAPVQPGLTVIGLLRVAITAASFIALVGFGRRQIRILGRLVLGKWIYVPLILLALTGALKGFSGLDASCRFALGIPGCVLAGLGLWRMLKSHAGKQCLGLQAAAMAIWFATPLIALATPMASYTSRDVNYIEKFLAAVQGPVEALMALCALGVWTGLGLYRSKLESSPGRKYRFSSCLAAAILLLVAIGCAAIDRHAVLTEKETQSDLVEAVVMSDPAQTDQQDAQSETIQAEAESQLIIEAEGNTVQTDWEQAMAKRQRMSMNMLKAAFIIVISLIGIYQCRNIGRYLSGRKKQSDAWTSPR